MGRNDLLDAADEAGILLWVDFSFASSLYPRDDEFVDLVKAEAAAQVTRLSHHPSVAIYCGSNEAVIDTVRDF